MARERLGRRLGGLYLTLTSEPSSTKAWATGSSGERSLGAYLESLDDGSALIVLHDRRIPASRANVDHIAVTRSGVVWAIDAKKYTGRVRRVDKSWFSTDQRLYVGRRDCTKLVHATAKQVAAVESAVGSRSIGDVAVDVRAALCFVDADWSRLAKPFSIEHVWIGWPKTLGKLLLAEGRLDAQQLEELARHVAAALPRA